MPDTENTPAFVGLILDIVFIALSIIALVIVFAVFLPAIYNACATGSRLQHRFGK